ncbi:class I SAM-dependent rRNA methyltransferase [Dissulfurimicrobium hydrothermale]|nr:class I SAM-dependent methyltransferase [Dissulfurimicrobium hydrothermale]
MKKGRYASVVRHHPWIFSGAIEKVIGNPGPGETVSVRSEDGAISGVGAYSPFSQIRVRFWAFKDREIDNSFFYERLKAAIKSRFDLAIPSTTNAYRLVNAESDGLPGLVIDRYSNFLVCQFLSQGVEYWRDGIIAQLISLVPNQGIFERSDGDVRQKEGLEIKTGLIIGEKPPNLIEIMEEGCKFLVDIKSGHKTGFYLDQRENRILLSRFSEGARILNCFSYTGGFAVWAIKGGAREVINIDSSRIALDLAEENARINNLDQGRMQNIHGDAFKILREFTNEREKFDIVVLDPPKFAMSKAGLPVAARGYKDINLSAFKLLRPGGLLFTFSCSGLMQHDLFQKIVFDAAIDAETEAQIITRLTQAKDHPTALNFPEGTYLKGLMCRISG